MSISIWRIAIDAPRYTADDLSGTGAAIEGGRWNEIGVPLLYAAQSRALACLETLVHMDGETLPFNRYLVRIDIPDAVWVAAARHTPGSLPLGWDAEPPGKISISTGTAWARQAATCLLRVPSVIVPEEENVLINPAHPDVTQIKAVKVRRWLNDPRLR